MWLLTSTLRILLTLCHGISLPIWSQVLGAKPTTSDNVIAIDYFGSSGHSYPHCRHPMHPQPPDPNGLVVWGHFALWRAHISNGYYSWLFLYSTGILRWWQIRAVHLKLLHVHRWGGHKEVRSLQVTYNVALPSSALQRGHHLPYLFSPSCMHLSHRAGMLKRATYDSKTKSYMQRKLLY